MALKHPTPGLRTIHYWGVSTGKAQINVNLGDELHVPEGVAEQLFAQSAQFKDGPAPEMPDPEPEQATVAYVSGDDLPVDPETYQTADEAPKPKRSRK